MGIAPVAKIISNLAREFIALSKTREYEVMSLDEAAYDFFIAAASSLLAVGENDISWEIVKFAANEIAIRGFIAVIQRAD